jgi:hypothetical protein
MLAKGIKSPVDEMIFVGVVTDCSTQSYSCTVTIPLKTAGFGVPCLWVSSGINRFGGCSDYCPPEIGSTVVIYLMKGTDFGLVLGQVPALVNDPERPGGGLIDPTQIVTAFNEDTGQVMKDLQIGGSALNGYQKFPNDAFPGDRGFYNELGIGLGVLRTAFYAKASDMAKIEGFLLEDLIRLTARNFDGFLGSCDIYSRDDYGYLTTEICSAMTYWESVGAKKEDEETRGLPSWRHRSFTGYMHDLKREFVSIPQTGKDADGKETLVPLGVAERLESSDGLRVERTITGGGIVKSRQIGIPTRVRPAESIAGAEDDPRPIPDVEDLYDFEWNFTEHGDVTPQMRDALAWLSGRQSIARMKPYSQDGDNPDWDIQDESEVGFDKENKGADVAAGGHYRDMLQPVYVGEKDPTQMTKPRVIRVNDAWIFILPDGSVTVRDGLGTAVTLTRGHIDISASKDVNITAGRNVNIKAGGDINLNAHDSVDVTAGNGQARLFGRKTVFVHSEDAGVVISTNGPGYKGDISKDGEAFDSSGIILKPHSSADVTVETQSLFIQANRHVLIGRNRHGIPDIYFEAKNLMNKVDQASWQLANSSYVQFANGPITIDTNGSINTEANMYAVFGTMKMNSTHDEHENSDFCNVPAMGYTLISDRLEPIYKNVKVSGSRSKSERNSAREKCGAERDDSGVTTGTPFDWNLLHSTFDRVEISYLIFSLRTERDYGTDTDDFSWTEQPWMREWSEATSWGDDAYTKAQTTSGGTRETWCYPGYKYWTGTKGFKTYKEENVDANGNPKKRDQLTKTGGSFSDESFKSMKRHP